jgi:hypothetical protein
MYVNNASDLAKHPALKRALRSSKSRDGFLRSSRDTPCAIAILRLIETLPELALAYRSTEIYSALTSRRGTLRLAVFTLVTAECTLHFLSSSRNASRSHTGLNPRDFSAALTSAWESVTDEQTDGLFDSTQSELPLASYDRLRSLSGVTLYQARSRKLTHHVLQMAVARSLLVRAIHRIASALTAHADDLVSGSGHIDSEGFFISLTKELCAGESEIRRARSILDLMGAKDKWSVIRATFALCHLSTESEFAVDSVSNTFPLDFMSIGRTPRGVAAAIKEAVARAGLARKRGVAGGLGRDAERQSQAALRDKAGNLPAKVLPVATVSDHLQPPRQPRAVASDLRAALRPIMLAMRAANIEPTLPHIRDVLSKGPLPNVEVCNRVLTTGIEQFRIRQVSAGTTRHVKYEFVVRGNPIANSYNTFNNTVHVLRKLIIKHEAQPG